MKHFIFTLMLASAISSQAQNSPYISKVIDFCPAPGQFVNVSPTYDEGDTQADLNEKVEELLAGEENGGLVSLGAWGGYIVVGFDHTIVNKQGEYDFKINGNAFYSGNVSSDGRKGGSSEPGIVMVSYDTNKNGLADDTWYELAGSEYYQQTTKHNYEVTYYRPDASASSDSNSTTNIYWKDNQGGCGYIHQNSFYKQSYFPSWIESDSLVFKGSRLADNGFDISGTGNNFILYAYDWGYADNHPNNTELSNFNIDWAVDSSGNPVNLPGVDFIKVYTGVLQVNGWIGECSTEITGIIDLHPDYMISDINNATESHWKISSLCRNELYIESENNCEAQLYNLFGQLLKSWPIRIGQNQYNTTDLPNGSYILHIASENISQSFKILIQNH